MPYSLQKSVEALRAAREKLAEQGTEFMIFQYHANSYYRQVTEKYDLPYIELDVPPLPRYVHDQDGHYSHAGHVEVARQLFEELSQRGVLDTKRGDETSMAAMGDRANTPRPDVARPAMDIRVGQEIGSGTGEGVHGEVRR